MRKLLLILSTVSFGFANPIDGYLENLAKEVKKTDPNFQGFDAKRGKKIFFSEHIGKRGKKNILCKLPHERFKSNRREYLYW